MFGSRANRYFEMLWANMGQAALATVAIRVCMAVDNLQLTALSTIVIVRIPLSPPRYPLELVARGLSNKQIAHSLEITETAAKNHVQHILQKLGARDRTQAATAAIQRGIIHL